MTIKASDVARILGGKRVLRRRVRSVNDLREVVEAGLPVESLRRAVEAAAGEGRDANELLHGIVPKTTLLRRHRLLNVEESQRLERLARVVALANEVWEDPERSREFLFGVQPSLGGTRPVDLARSELGARQVEELLYQMEYSLPV
jgi:putative toxin-antitoxin system antitoxin component (TIGR02293 family)